MSRINLAFPVIADKSLKCVVGGDIWRKLPGVLGSLWPKAMKGFET